MILGVPVPDRLRASHAIIAALVVAAVAGCQSQLSVAPMALELAMRPGAFAGFDGTSLGDAVTFENDIDSARCYPLLDATDEPRITPGQDGRGDILLWIHRAHRVDDRVFVETCDLDAPLDGPANRVAGHVSAWWSEAALVDTPGPPRVELRRLAIAGWSPFSAPSFCGAQVAFWSLAAGGELSARVVDLLEPRPEMSASFGVVEIAGSDMGWGARPAEWSAGCGEATFKMDSGQTRVIEVAAPH